MGDGGATEVQGGKEKKKSIIKLVRVCSIFSLLVDSYHVTAVDR